MEITREQLRILSLKQLKETFSFELRGLKKLNKSQIIDHILSRKGLVFNGTVV